MVFMSSGPGASSVVSSNRIRTPKITASRLESTNAALNLFCCKFIVGMLSCSFFDHYRSAVTNEGSFIRSFMSREVLLNQA